MCRFGGARSWRTPTRSRNLQFPQPPQTGRQRCAHLRASPKTQDQILWTQPLARRILGPKPLARLIRRLAILGSQPLTLLIWQTRQRIGNFAGIVIHHTNVAWQWPLPCCREGVSVTASSAAQIAEPLGTMNPQKLITMLVGRPTALHGKSRLTQRMPLTLLGPQPLTLLIRQRIGNVAGIVIHQTAATL